MNTFKYSLKNNLPEFENAWFGYIGYELGLYKNNLYSLELPSSQLPPLWMILYRIILEFNHKNQKVSAYVADNEAIPYIPKPEKANDIKPKISEIKSNMNRLEYEDSVRKILLAIKAGVSLHITVSFPNTNDPKRIKKLIMFLSVFFPGIISNSLK